MAKLSYQFSNEKLRDLALTQSGADAENNNERMEFLGDRVLGLTVAALLFEMFPNESEGELARRHAALVSTETLADVAESMDLAKKIRHGHMTAGRMRHMMADALESLFGAIYLDGGFDAARDEILKIWRELAMRELSAPKDAKTELQEFAQRTGGGALPEYEFMPVSGPSHSPVFHARVTVSEQSATGRGASKKLATAMAAAELLKILKAE